MTTEEERCEIYSSFLEAETEWDIKAGDADTVFNATCPGTLFFFSQNKEKWESEQENVVEKI